MLLFGASVLFVVEEFGFCTEGQNESRLNHGSIVGYGAGLDLFKVMACIMARRSATSLKGAFWCAIRRVVIEPGR